MIASETWQRVEDWIEWMLGRGRKENTAKSYRKCLRMILQRLDEDDRPTAPERITDDDVIWYQRNSGVSETVTRMNLGRLGSWVLHYTGTDVVKEAKLLWNAPSHPNRVFITEEEAAELDSHADVSTHLILVLGCCLGLRKSEIAAIQLSDIHDGRLTVRGKGHGDGKVAVLRIPPAVSEAIDEWMPIRRELILSSRLKTDTLLLSNNGTVRPMSTKTIDARMAKLTKLTGIKVTPHSLRRRYATALYEAHVDLTDIVTLMRHENPSTTYKCYIQSNQARLDAIADNVRLKK